MKPTDINTKISLLRTAASTALSVVTAAETAASTKYEKLKNAVCKKAGLSEKYLDLVQAVVKNPMTGAYSCQYERIINNAIEKGVISHISGGSGWIIRGPNGSSSNHWYEPGKLGKEMLTDLMGEQYQYVSPGIPAKQA